MGQKGSSLDCAEEIKQEGLGQSRETREGGMHLPWGGPRPLKTKPGAHQGLSELRGVC